MNKFIGLWVARTGVQFGHTRTTFISRPGFDRREAVLKYASPFSMLYLFGLIRLGSQTAQLFRFVICSV